MTYIRNKVEGQSYRNLEQMKPLIVIAGPTCVGKTATALELATLLNAEVISADSRQVYRGMDIGTAKVSKEEREHVPHHLIDVVNPDELFSVADFVKHAEAAIKEIESRGKIPLIVGGTGLYVRVLTEGYAIPTVPPDNEIRKQLAKEAQVFNCQSLHKELAVVDPETASKIHPNDFRRVSRALEVYRTTGIPISQLKRQKRIVSMHNGNGENQENNVFKFALTIERNELYEKIDNRADDQIKMGLLEEVRGLLAQGYSPSLRAFQTFGYQELIPYLEGLYSLEEGIYRIKRNTRRFAKRQWTWFKQEPNVQWIEVTDKTPSREIAETIFKQYKKKTGR